MNVVEASGLGKRYGGTWALRECTLAIPAGRVAALVGPNGAGKSTLLNLAVGLSAPSAGEVTVLGGRRAGSPAALDGIAFVAQDTPLYKNLPVADMIYVTRSLNRRFDQPYAHARLNELGIPPKRKAGKLSGGQQAQLALTLALARRPRLLVLDEPVAMLDPVARHDFMATVLAAASADGVSVLLSSHVLSELERVASDLILLSRGRVRRMAGVTWRQHRIALAGVAVLLGALAVYLWIAGLQLHHAYAAAVACRPASSAACQGLDNTLDSMDNFLSNGLMLQVLPVLIGAFVGAPVLARELETGTFRFAWTQGFGRWRWALAKLVLLAVVVTAAAGAFGALLSWFYQLFLGNQSLGLPRTTPFSAGLFDLRGIGVPRLDASRLRDWRLGRDADPPGRPCARRDPCHLRRARLRDRGVPARALPDAGAHIQLLRPARQRVDRQPVVDQGRQVGLRRLPPSNLLSQFCPSPPAGKGGPSQGWGPCLVQHGYTQWTSYQPASRFWPFQWIEGGWLLALSALLIAATLWLVQRRAA